MGRIFWKKLVKEALEESTEEMVKEWDRICEVKGWNLWKKVVVKLEETEKN